MSREEFDKKFEHMGLKDITTVEMPGGGTHTIGYDEVQDIYCYLIDKRKNNAIL